MTNLEVLVQTNPTLSAKIMAAGWDESVDCGKGCPLLAECDGFQCGEFVREWLLKEVL